MRKSLGLFLLVVALLVAACSPPKGGKTPTPTGVPDCADRYESPVRDDTASGAKLLSEDQSQLHRFDGPKDIDWVAINVLACDVPCQIDVLTYDLGEAVDTVLSLADSQTKNDNDPVEDRGYASRLSFVAQKPGTYAVKVENKWGSGGCGPDYVYSVKLEKTPIEVPTPTGVPTARPTATSPTVVPSSTKAPQAIGPFSVKWVDATKTTKLLGSKGEEIAVWDLAKLQELCMANGVIGQDEVLTPVTSGQYIALAIMDKNKKQAGWLRVGSLPGGYAGQICRCAGEAPTGGCWKVTTLESWTQVLKPATAPTPTPTSGAAACLGSYCPSGE